MDDGDIERTEEAEVVFIEGFDCDLMRREFEVSRPDGSDNDNDIAAVLNCPAADAAELPINVFMFVGVVVNDTLPLPFLS